ncbi:hypothetical protein DPQ33_11810 [Oceanidesulfovibrio indonesiensis]|uniref:Uncharacterized protein n=1 Tax=Oceanidesulfovibrio indonesiensis TaxID=54767 RepID=A0A7M3MEA1_9BACT|nr:hypothetical protein [Oceanidesulfovibrio indonesiensis]TVM16672.1 hypothetical protein DPQ33_11810 [Oceanidesulfovibrio indonesiensis]
MQIDGTTTSLFQSLAAYGSGQGGSGFRLSQRNGDGMNTSDAFGLDMTRRLEATQPAATEKTTDESGEGPEQTIGKVEASRLGKALAQAVEFIREKFGDDAATAAMGIVYQSGGDGQLTEESLGKGLLNVVRMVDRNYGFAAGDMVMGQFNGELNNALNNYFDNGFQETFFAVTPEVSQNMADALAAVKAGSGLDDIDIPSLIDMLRSSLEEGGELTDETVKTLEQATLDPRSLTPERLQRLAAQAVPAESGATQPSAYDMAATAQYGAGPQTGMLLNATV